MRDFNWGPVKTYCSLAFGVSLQKDGNGITAPHSHRVKWWRVLELLSRGQMRFSKCGGRRVERGGLLLLIHPLGTPRTCGQPDSELLLHFYASYSQAPVRLASQQYTRGEEN
jgi:hypothetical protein